MLLRKFKKAQGATEYAIFIAAVLAGLLALQVYYSRSVKGNMKGRADSIGEQFDGEAGEYIKESRSASTRQSFTNMNETGMISAGVSASDAAEWSDGRHSMNVAATKSKADTIKSGDWLNVFGGTAAASKHVSGDVSSTEYVTNFAETQAQHSLGFGTHGVATMGDITGSGESVFSDAGVYRTQADCLAVENTKCDGLAGQDKTDCLAVKADYCKRFD